MKKIFFILNLLFLASASRAGIFNTNIIVNGNAEAGVGSTNGDTIVPIPGWTATGGFNVDQFGPASDTIPATTPGPSDKGSNFFAGGPGNASSSAYQIIDVSAGGVTIDSGAVQALLTGWIGGFDGQEDYAVVTAGFYDTNSTVLGALTIGPVSSADRSGFTSFLFRSAATKVPAGTRQIKVTITCTRQSGTYNDGYADDLSLVLAGPALTVTPAAHSAILSWTTNYTGLHLESTASLSPPVHWSPATNAIFVSGGQHITTNQLSGRSQFFRLSSP